MQALNRAADRRRVPRRRWRIALAFGPGLVAAVALAYLDPISQPAEYHLFADRRGWMGIPFAADVLSNLPFVLVGALAIWQLRRGQRLTPEYGTFFLGVALSGVGSMIYHWNPDNLGLAVDRLPMTLGFAGIFSALVGERIDPGLGRRLLLPMCVAGIASVLWWIGTESRGQGDLRWYLLAQFYPLIALPLILLLFPSRFSRRGDYWVLIACYALAKLAEMLDRETFAATGDLISGHSLKHLLAAFGTIWLLRMLLLRQPLPPPGT